MAQSNSQLFSQPVNFGKNPPEGARIISQAFDFSTAPSFVLDMNLIKQLGKMSTVQSVFIDNSAGAQKVTVQCNQFNQLIALAPGDQGWFPIAASDNSVFTVASAGSAIVNVAFCNILVQGVHWTSTVQASSISGTVTTADTVLDATVTGGRVQTLTTPAANVDTNHSGTITLGGTSQTLMNANAARKGWMIMNIDETNLEEIGIALFGAAAIGSPGTFTLSASGGAGYPGGFMQGFGTGAITIIAATTGHAFTAIEW